jgi:hypothetical protein
MPAMVNAAKINMVVKDVTPNANETPQPQCHAMTKQFPQSDQKA